MVFPRFPLSNLLSTGYSLNSFSSICTIRAFRSTRERKMLKKSRLVLRDGTTLDELIDVDMNEVSMRVMGDEELYRHEMERIFARTWLLLGHESEIPKAGDFVMRDMGEDNVIVSRDRA